DRKAFNIKTLDASGKAIEKIPHEVTAVLTVNGEEITLCRRFKEKWVRKRGSVKDEFTGHEEERLYNDVPMSVKDWTEKINAICTEETFKFITNPNYFPMQKADAQRAMLMRMAGDVSDEEIAFGNDDFQALLGQLTGKTMEEYKREIAAKKRTIKAEIETIPARIEECKRMMPESENWQELEAELEGRQKLLAKVEGQISDKATAFSEANNERMKKSKRVGELKSERMDLEFKIKERVQADYNDKRNKQLDLQRQVANDERDLRNEEKMLAGYEDEFERLKANKETLIKEWREINARQLVFDDNAFVCPTCGRQLEIDDIERKQGEMTEKFNARKAADLEANNRKGQAMKQRMTEVEASISGSKMKIGQLEEKIAKEKANELYTATLTAPDATPAIEADAEYQRLTSEIEALEKELAVPTTAPDTAELSEKKKQYAADIDEIKTKLAKRDTINRTNKRISELETQLRTQSDELSGLEGMEFTIAAFSKAKIEAVESRINHLFSIVRFKMFETQINGGEVETCEATVDGVPYSDLNNAMKINAGLDIINAICKSEGVTAPIFIDNAESINELMPTESQMIRLVVTEDDTLIIQ
ncbi:MAG: hypothetical protein IJK36_06450, partial [Bacteroidales bacterium]|nr:hypothetical protein [Bacteroidales bacterium]